MIALLRKLFGRGREEAVLPCPHCGGRPIFDGSGSWMVIRCGRMSVKCVRSGLNGSNSRRKAIESWNHHWDVGFCRVCGSRFKTKRTAAGTIESFNVCEACSRLRDRSGAE